MTGHLNGTLTYLIETREKDGKKFTLIKVCPLLEDIF